MTSALPPLVQACSGALGSAAANAVSYPLDLVATKLQTTTSRRLRGLHGTMLLLKHIMDTEGLAGMYDGLGADTASTIVSKYVPGSYSSSFHIGRGLQTSSCDMPMLREPRMLCDASVAPSAMGVCSSRRWQSPGTCRADCHGCYYLTSDV